MRRSLHRHPVAILREICDLYQKEFADLIGCSRMNLQKIEQTKAHHGHGLSPKLAQRIFHETGVSLDWLRGGDPTAPPVSGRGEPYTLEIFQRAQAEKKYFDRPHPFFQNNDARKCCARVVAILQSASKRNAYYMAMWKLGAALDALQKEFGQEPGPEWTNKQVDLLKPLIEQGKDPVRAAKRYRELSVVPMRFNAAPRSKQSSKKKPRRS
jgi:transcriptional regulator with XRE-family HTH domain